MRGNGLTLNFPVAVFEKSKKAGAIAFMTGRAIAFCGHFEKQSIAVAIQ